METDKRKKTKKRYAAEFHFTFSAAYFLSVKYAAAQKLPLQFLFHKDQFILSCSKTDLLRMSQTRLIFGIWRCIFKMIVVITEMFRRHPIRKLTVRKRSHFQTGIHTGLIQRERIKRCKHSDIREDRRIIFRMTVAVRRHVHHK